MNRNQIATITVPASAPATQVQRQTRSGVLYAGADPAAAPRARARPRCRHCGELRQGHAKYGCPNVNPPIPKASHQRTPRMVSNPCHNVINQQQVNVEIHYHVSPIAPPALNASVTLPPADSQEPTSPSTGHSSDGTTNSSSRLNENNWDHVHALLRAHPMLVVTIAMAREDLASEELVAQEHGYAVKLVYPEDSWEDPGRGLFILARDAAALDDTYNRVRKAAKVGTPLTTIVRQESFKSPGGTIEGIVDEMKELDVGRSMSQGSRKPRKSRKKRST